MPFLHHPYPDNINPFIAALLFETFLYGISLVLFVVCIVVLVRLNKELQWGFLVSAVVMFALATADITYSLHLLFGKILGGGLTIGVIRPRPLLYVTTSFLADSLLIYRCYRIWNSNIAILIGSASILVAGTVFGYVIEGTAPIMPSQYGWIYLIFNVIFNVSVTTLTAGRICWITSRAKQTMDGVIYRRCCIALVIIMESGAVNSLYIGLVVALRNCLVGHIMLDAGIIQILVIMPLLIIVQSGLCRTVLMPEVTHTLELGHTITDRTSTTNTSATHDIHV